MDRQSNADRGKWLDDPTRHDGMVVDCETRSVELKLYVKLPFNELPRNWQDRMERTWSDDYCGDTAWAASITHHWRVTLIVVSIADETPLVARRLSLRFAESGECHQGPLSSVSDATHHDNIPLNVVRGWCRADQWDDALFCRGGFES